MKNYVMILFFALCATVLSYSQKGNFLIGTSAEVGGGVSLMTTETGMNNAVNSGGIGFYKLKTEYETFIVSNEGGVTETVKEDIADVVVFNLSPRVGYFFTNSLAGGVKVDIFYSSVNFDGYDYKITSQGLAAGPFARYYIGLGKVRPYVELDAIFGTMKTKDDDDESTMNTIQLGGGVGVAIWLNDFISFDVLAGYSSATFKDPDSELLDKNIVNGFGLSLGLSMILAGK